MGSRRTQVCCWLRGEDHLRLLLWGGQWLVIGNLQIVLVFVGCKSAVLKCSKKDNKLSKQVGSEAHQASNPKHSDSSGLAPQRCAPGRWIHWLQDSRLFRLCQGISSSALPQASSYGLNYLIYSPCPFQNSPFSWQSCFVSELNISRTSNQSPRLQSGEPGKQAFFHLSCHIGD